MELHNLKPAEGSTKNRKRVGRGQGSTRGRTSTRGHKGAQSRSGYSRKMGFEGGQMPLQRRVPKFGFKNPNRVEYSPINLDALTTVLQNDPTNLVDKEYLLKHSLVGKKDLVKILGRGEINQAIEVKANAFSGSAKEAIEKAGGTATVV